ncbi:MAG: glycoside hydrolase family 57 protein [Mariprofundaceae bacterium]|nr:glycoside hydrolase family 57 protein [Mariprofundaceae bacterium]
MSQPLSVVFCWHMHQPFYREADTGHYHLPWVYLHAIKDYTDMAVLLEQVDGARAVINYVPSLTEQIADYTLQLQAWLKGDIKHIPDALLDQLASPSGVYSAEERAFLLESCFRLNHERNLHRYADYSRLLQLMEHAKANAGLDYLSDAYFTDLVTWYHLGWLGETVRNSHATAKRLFAKARGFDQQDRHDLIALIAELLADIPKLYKKLVEDGKIEISTTPYAHPIIPLMLDFSGATDTVPDALLPQEAYPGAKVRAKAHISQAIDAHIDYFGHKPTGCWPAEGAVSAETLALMAEAKFAWCATGETVLHHSRGFNIREHEPHDLYHPWLMGEKDSNIACFFRDDHLSDLIGFEYSKWGTEDAVNNFMHELAGIKHRSQGLKAPVVSIIMDGENAWEHFHENGVHFLSQLYQAIADHDDYSMTTFEDYLKVNPADTYLEKMVPGSWVYGNFSTWIGDRAKTRAWELLIEVKHAFDAHSSKLSSQDLAEAEKQLSICEGSDWCWWFGDYNPSGAVRDFDNLYRQHLKKLYQMLGLTAPTSLDENISQGGGDAEGGGAMRRGGAAE